MLRWETSARETFIIKTNFLTHLNFWSPSQQDLLISCSNVSFFCHLGRFRVHLPSLKRLPLVFYGKKESVDINTHIVADTNIGQGHRMSISISRRISLSLSECTTYLYTCGHALKVNAWHRTTGTDYETRTFSASVSIDIDEHATKSELVHSLN